MTEAAEQQQQQRIAIIGGGVAGLAAAWHLQVNCCHKVDLFEAAPRLGGHAYTVRVPLDDDIESNENNNKQEIDVDIGFMVFNHANYPNLIEWFRLLGIQEQDSDMSLSVSLDKDNSDTTTIEWSSDGLSGLLANPKQALKWSFWQFLGELLRFHQQAPQVLQLDDDDPRKHITTEQYLLDHNYSDAFCQYYLLPMMAALWSASMHDVLNFPIEQVIGFLCNHKMLQLWNRPQWKTVAGRSQSYTSKLKQVLEESSAHVLTPIDAVTKLSNGMFEVKSGSKVVGTFDQVIFACHPPTARRILEAGGYGHEETDLLDLLGQVQYADNVVYVHSDPQLMPARPCAWASWNCLGRSVYLTQAMEGTTAASSGFGNTTIDEEQQQQQQQTLEGQDGRMKAVYVTYWLNRLQNLETPKPIFVSLNPHQHPDPALTYHRLILAHPQFTPQTLHARQTLQNQYQGRDGLWFCGAWAGYGFHEDGCRSGFEVATQLSQTPLPWCIADKATTVDDHVAARMVLPPPDFTTSSTTIEPKRTSFSSMFRQVYQKLFYELPVAACKRFIYNFLEHAVQKGTLRLKLVDGSMMSFGDGTPCAGCCDSEAVTLRIFDDWFFVKTALEYDLGLARSYMAGYFVVEPLDDPSEYNPILRPPTVSRDETTMTLGDPIGLVRLFLLLIGNRDHPQAQHVPRKAGKGHWYSHAMTNASGLIISKIGSLFNYLRYKLTMDNSERGGSLRNIQAHYDLSNDLFTTFLDKETLMYSSSIFDAITAPPPSSGLVLRGTLEQAQWRKLDTLLSRAQIRPGMTLLDIGFGWGGLSMHAAKKYGCKVTGITLSVEQKALAEKRVQEQGLESLITFEVVDYRTFARRKENWGKFDRVLSCEMIEAVGHRHLGKFFWAVEQLLAHDGIFVMEAITTPEQRYETYLRSTDFINTIIFPGSCCPSLHALVDAAYRQSCLTLEHIDNIGLHYAETLAEWRRRFNANESDVRSLGFDDVFLRAWNYYLTYCQAGFFSQTENCLILVFARQGCKALAPLCETRSVTQAPPLSGEQVNNWLADAQSMS